MSISDIKIDSLIDLLETANRLKALDLLLRANAIRSEDSRLYRRVITTVNRVLRETCP